jgi:hypothetical protein
MRLLGGRVRGKQSRCAARRKSAEANKPGPERSSASKPHEFLQGFRLQWNATLKSCFIFSGWNGHA